MIREEIRKSIERGIQGLQKEKRFPAFNIPEIMVERPEQPSKGDYSTNISFQIAKPVKKSPFEIAKLITESLNGKEFFDKIEAVEPGFINFFLSEKYLQGEVQDILTQKEKFGNVSVGKGKKVNIEFVSANPTGPLHLGHGRGAFWGDVLSNVFQRAGYKVTKEYFINDHGRQVSLLGKSINARYLEILGEKSNMEEDFYQGEYIKDIAKEIFEKDGKKHLSVPEEKRVKLFSEQGLQQMVKEAKSLLKKAGVEFDVWFSESSLYKKGKIQKTIESLKKKNMTYEKEGALWFSSTKFKDDKDRILLKASGEPTYFTSDIAYHQDKVSRKYDLLINGWGADHWGYVQRMMAAAKVFGFEKKLKIVVGQFVRLVEKGKEIKMRKRTGIFFPLKDLIEEVGIDVTRFFFLMKSVDTHIDFNLDLAKEQSSKNPVYYIQYAHARICSILKKVKGKKKVNLGLLTHSSELGLIKQLIRFPEIIEDTSKDFQVQRVCQYTTDLATAFHQFYRDCKVLDEKEELKVARISLLLATQSVLKSALDVIGVSSPVKM
ncbi:arginine--tRNA ligase [Patescibacteria group bacterium]